LDFNKWGIVKDFKSRNGWEMDWGIIASKARNERRKKTKTDVDGRRVAAAEHFPGTDGFHPYPTR
jgi:hypothetical protein